MKRYAVLFFLLFNWCLSFAQPDLKFHTLSPEGGLSYDGILDIKQDGKGFVWIMLENNLYRFDGYVYKSFKTYFLNSIDSDVFFFNNIVIDCDGIPYISTTYGIYRFDYDTETFDMLFDGNNKRFYIDNQKTFWIHTNDGLAFLKDDELVFPQYKARKLALNTSLFCEKGNDLYLFSNYGQVYRYNRAENTIENCTNINSEINGSHIADAKIHNDELWMLTGRFSLFRIDLATCRINYRHHNPGFENINIRCLFVSDENNLWVGTMNGLYIFNTQTQEITRYQHNENEAFSLPNNSIWTISKDRQNNIWMGTYMGSVAYVNPQDKNAFKTFRPSPEGLNKIPVSGFAEDQDNIWISTEGGGVNILDKKTLLFSHLMRQPDRTGLSSNNTKALVNDDNGNIWISTYRGGLVCYDTHTKRFVNYNQAAEPDSKTLVSNNIRKIVLEPDSGLWISYMSKVTTISYFSFEKKQFAHYTFSPTENRNEENAYIYDIYRGRDNKIWAVTALSLHEFDIRSARFVTEYRIPSEKKATASTLCMDDNGKIWIGTSGNEMIRFDPSTKEFDLFPGILQSNISEIYSINHGNGTIWLGTNDGLYQFNTLTNSCAVFKESDGTQGNVYYPLATMKGDDGRLYFGGTEGFTIVDPQKISFNPTKPNVIISGFYIDNEPASEKWKSDDERKSGPVFPKIRLTYKEQGFGFNISCDNYLNPGKNQFKYRLKNFNDEWTITDAANRTIHFPKIPPGSYLFEVQAANNDGVWGDISSIAISRKQAPWLTTQATILYLILFCGLLYYILATYLNRKRLEMQLYRDRLRKEKDEEIHKNQLQFFTNISHDLKTPLSLIMATINRMREEGMKEYYFHILNSNAERLMRQLNDILDFRKIQNNKMKLEVSENDLARFVHDLAADFTDYAIEQDIHYTIEESDDDLSEVTFDKKIVEMIVLNLLNNAFKYTPKGGSIKVSYGMRKHPSPYAHSHTIGQNDQLDDSNTFFVAICDTGIGIAEESFREIFEQFHRVETKDEASHAGFGIGLALVKELTLIHRGSITIYSDVNVGTDFVIRLPKHPGGYLPGEIRQNAPQNAIAAKTSPESRPEPENKLLINNKSEYQKEIKGKTILITEDHDDFREILGASLGEKYEVVAFDSATASLDYLKKKDTDLIISDIMMPEMDGVTFCKLIKKNIETSHIPFILLTAKSGIDSMLEGTESGADLYFEKPINFTLLKASIHNIFKQQETLREHYAKNYFADVSDITSNKEDGKFLAEVVAIIDENVSQSNLNVNNIASKMMMSRSKLYSKIKALTGKSIIEFILRYRLHRAAKLLAESNISIQEAMFEVGIESQSYFTNAFKKEFGMLPSKFAAKYKSGGQASMTNDGR